MLANQLTRVTLLTTSLQCGQTGSVVSHRLSKVLGRGPHDMDGTLRFARIVLSRDCCVVTGVLRGSGVFV